MLFTGCFKDNIFQIYVVFMELATVAYYFILIFSEYTDYNRNKILTYACIYLVASVIFLTLVYSIISLLLKLFSRYRDAKYIVKVGHCDSNIAGFRRNIKLMSVSPTNSQSNSNPIYNSVVEIGKIDCREENEKLDCSEIAEKLDCDEIAESFDCNKLEINDYN